MSSNVAPLYLPVGWGEQRAIANAFQANDLLSSLYPALRVLAALRWGGVVLSVLGVLGTLYFRYSVVPRCRRLDDEEEAEATSEDGYVGYDGDDRAFPAETETRRSSYGRVNG